MTGLTTDDTIAQRQTTAVQAALAAALVVLLAGREALDLGRSVTTQLGVTLLTVVVALVAERISRPTARPARPADRPTDGVI